MHVCATFSILCTLDIIFTVLVRHSTSVILNNLPSLKDNGICEDLDWPEYNEDEMLCPYFTSKQIKQPNIPWGVPKRAWLTVPPEIQIRESQIPGGGLGAFATTHLSKGTWLGAYEGEIFTTKEDEYVTDYCWVSYRADDIAYYTDSGRIETSNWLRWVNCPRNPQEENVEALHCFGKIFYRTTKSLDLSDELFVYYGDEYAESLGINVTMFNL